MKAQVFSPREAIKAARRLGWNVEPKRKSGDMIFLSPTGERFTSRAPGRADRVPLVLAKALTTALDAVADRGE